MKTDIEDHLREDIRQLVDSYEQNHGRTFAEVLGIIRRELDEIEARECHWSVKAARERRTAVAAMPHITCPQCSEQVPIFATHKDGDNCDDCIGEEA